MEELREEKSIGYRDAHNSELTSIRVWGRPHRYRGATYRHDCCGTDCYNCNGGADCDDCYGR
jgi:hypothetical protein